MAPRLLRVLMVLAVLAIACAAHAVALDPRAGTSTPPPENQPTPQQINQQMEGPKVMPPVSNTMDSAPQVHGPDLPSGDPQAVLAVTTGPGRAEPLAKKSERDKGGSNVTLGLAITCALLGLVAFGGMLVVRKGPRQPVHRESIITVDADSSDEDVYEI